MDFDYRLIHPFNMISSGGTQSGKSTMIAELIRRRKEMITPEIVRVIYCHTEYQPVLFGALKDDLGTEIEFVKGMDFDVAEGNSSPTLVILDDLMEEASTAKSVSAMFTRGTIQVEVYDQMENLTSQYCIYSGSHHRSMSVILTLQNFHFKGVRNLTLNSKYITITKSVRDSTAIKYLGRDMNCGKKNEFVEAAYEDATRNREYAYLFLDFNPIQNDKYRLRSSIFPENCIVYTPK